MRPRCRPRKIRLGRIVLDPKPQDDVSSCGALLACTRAAGVPCRAVPQPPPLHIVQQFCADAQAWLADDPQHVVVVHCKAGKGRTGTLVCALLMHMQVSHPSWPHRCV